MTAVFAAVVAGVFGLAIGSFLNVVVARVPFGSPLTRPSACPECRTPIRPHENVPLLSWMLLRGRCAACRAPISARYPLIEAGTALAFAGVTALAATRPDAFALAWWPALLAFLYLVAISIALAAIDLDTHRLPDAIVLPSYPVAITLLTTSSVTGGDLWALAWAAAGGILLYGLYYVLRLARPDGMGGGDVKLAGVLGLSLGWLGWGELAVGAFAGFVWGAVFGMLLMLRHRATRRTRIPFGPFMLLGAWTGAIAGAPIGAWYAGWFA